MASLYMCQYLVYTLKCLQGYPEACAFAKAASSFARPSADDFSKYDDWEQDAIREAVDVVENWDDYVELPDREEVNKYGIMENFCYSQEEGSFCNGKKTFSFHLKLKL